MTKLKNLLLTTVMSICSASTVLAGEVKVIANPSVGATEISADDLKKVFLGTKSSLADGSRVEPVLEKGGPAHNLFLKEYIGKTEDALNTYYRSQVFTGKGSMPKILGSDSEVAAYVAKTKGAIGYVAATAATAGTKVLDVK